MSRIYCAVGILLFGVAGANLAQAKPVLLSEQGIIQAMGLLTEWRQLKTDGKTVRAGTKRAEFCRKVDAIFPPGSRIEITDRCPLIARSVDGGWKKLWIMVACLGDVASQEQRSGSVGGDIALIASYASPPRRHETDSNIVAHLEEHMDFGLPSGSAKVGMFVGVIRVSDGRPACNAFQEQVHVVIEKAEAIPWNPSVFPTPK